MKITYELKDPELLTIFIEGEAWRDVHIAIFGRRPKLPKEVTSLSDWQAAFEQLEYQAVKQYTLRRLASRSYHSYQLRKLLIERLVSPAMARRILAECTQWGYLDDEAWINSFMQSHLKRSSLRALTMKLRAKGLPPALIEEIAEQWKDPEQEIQAVKRLLETRYRSKNLSQFKEKQKVIGALLRKGYPFEVIQQAIDQID